MVGITKDGVIVEIADPDEVMLQIAYSLKDAIALDIMPFVHIQANEVEEKL